MTDTPKEGEWWWARVPGYEKPEPIWRCDKLVFPGAMYQWTGRTSRYRDRDVELIARIPDPPASEPSEAVKVLNSALASFQANENDVRQLSAADLCERIEAAGYVLVPTSGPGFEAMVAEASIAYDRSGAHFRSTAITAALRAALETCKGEG